MNGINSLYKQTIERVKLGVGFWNNFTSLNLWQAGDFLIVMSGNNQIDNIIAGMFDDIINYYHANRLFMLSREGMKFDDSRVVSIEIPEREYLAFVTLFRLYKFSQRVVFADYLLVAQSDLMLLEGINGIDALDIARVAILGIADKSKGRPVNCAKEECSLPRLNYELEGFEKGYGAYKTIRKEFENELICYNNRASGNTFFLCCFLLDYIKRKGQDYIVVNERKECKNICDLMDIKSIYIDKNTGECLKKFCDTVGIGLTGFRTMDPYNTRTNLINIRGYKNLDFRTIYERLLYEREIENIYNQNLLKSVPFSDATDEIKKHKLDTQKTILIAPDTNTVASYSTKAWENIIEKLKAVGYSIVINSADNDKFKDEKKLLLPYDKLMNFVSHCYAVIAGRSGLCEIVSQSSSKMIILYHKSGDVKKDDLMFGYFSMTNMRLRDTADTMELLCDESDIPIDSILQFLGA